MVSHYLNQWWPGLLKYICITRPQWIRCNQQQCWLILYNLCIDLVSKTRWKILLKFSANRIRIFRNLETRSHWSGRICVWLIPLQWRHNGRDGVSNHRRHDCLPNRFFRRRSRKTSNPRVTDLCEGNLPVTGEFAAQRSSNAENVSIRWRHHVYVDLISLSIVSPPLTEYA